MGRASHAVDGIRVSLDAPHLAANAGPLLVTTVALRLDPEALVNAMVRLGRKSAGHDRDER